MAANNNRLEHWQEVGEIALTWMERQLTSEDIRKVAIAMLAAHAVGKNRKYELISEITDQNSHSLYETVAQLCVNLGVIK